MNSQFAVVVMLLVGALAAGMPVAPTDVNEAPLADAGLDQSVSQGSTVLLDGGGSRDPDGEIVSYSWNITAPGGSSVAPDCRTCERTQFVAAQRGVYEVSLIVTDDDGARSSDTLYVTVGSGSGLSVTLAGPDETTVERTVTYDATVDGGGATLDELLWRVNGTVVRRDDLAGDGTTRRLPYTFTETGTANVSVTAVDDAGNVATDDLSVMVTSSNVTDPNDPPDAFIKGPNRVTPDTSVAFVLDATDPDNDTLTVNWTNVDTGSAAGATRSFDGHDPGDTVTITAEVSDGEHNVTATKTVQVVTSGGNPGPGANKPPQASISGPATIPVGEWGNFDVSASDPDGTVIDISWSNVYDSGIDDPISVTREFSSPGLVTISVTVTDDDGATTTAMHTINVTNSSTATPTATSTGTATATPDEESYEPSVTSLGAHTNTGEETKKSDDDVWDDPVSETWNTMTFVVHASSGGAPPGTPIQVNLNFGDGTSATTTLVVQENGQLPTLEIGHKFPDINETTTYTVSATAYHAGNSGGGRSSTVTFTPNNDDVQGKTQYGVILTGPETTEPNKGTLTVSSPTKYKAPPEVIVYFGDGTKVVMNPPDTGEFSTSVVLNYDEPGTYVASAVVSGHSSNGQANNDQHEIKVKHPTYTVWRYHETKTVYNKKTTVSVNKPGPKWEYLKVDDVDSEYITSVQQPKALSAPSADPPYHWKLDRTYYMDEVDQWWQAWSKYKTITYVKWKKVVEVEKEGPVAYSSSAPADEDVYKDTDEKVTYSCEDSGNPLWGDHCTDQNGGGEI
jgi:hypothetical protein